MQGEGTLIFRRGDMDRLAKNRRANQKEIAAELTVVMNKHDLAGIAFLVPEADGNRGLMLVNKKRSTVIEFLALTADYCQQVLQGLPGQSSRTRADD